MEAMQAASTIYPHPRPDIRIHTKLDFMRNDYAEYCPNNEGNNWAF